MPSTSERKGVGIFGWLRRLLLLGFLLAGAGVFWWVWQNQRESEVLRRMVERLTAEDRVAEVWVESRQSDTPGRPGRIRLKILEYDAAGKALQPVHCEFSLNDVIHFEALVIRLNDDLVMGGNGKSIHLFRRAFALDNSGNTYESCDINRPLEIPGGYRLPDSDRFVGDVQQKYWRSFWQYALDEKSRQAAGVKNAQIEAPATRLLSDKIYRLVLERDGGLRIEASDIPAILKGERLGR